MIKTITIILFPILSGVFTIYAFNKLDQSKYQVRGVTPPYFAALVLMFSLFASLTAGDVWQRISKENALITSEADSLRSILRYSDFIDASHKAKVVDLVERYKINELRLNSATQNTGEIYVGVNQAWLDLYKIAMDPQFRAKNSLLQEKFLTTVLQLKSDRFQRIESSKSHISIYKLIVITIFGVLTQFAIALCHAGEFRALVATVTLFSVAFSVAMGFLTIFESNSMFASLISFEPFIDAI